MIVRTLLAVALAAAVTPAFANSPALPSAGLKHTGTEHSPLTIPAADVRSLVEEDSKALGQAMRYGVVQRVDQPLLTAGEARQGTWLDLADGRTLWSMDLHSANAVSLDLQFSRFTLPEDAELFIGDASGDYVLGPIRGSDALANGQYFSHLIPGDSARIEVITSAATREQIDLVLAGITYGYRGILGLDDHAEAPRSGSCNIDVVCPLGDDWGDQIDSVGQYIFTRPNGSFVCTGSLIGNTGGTPIPYFITANHCVSTEDVAQTMRIYWNYQSPTCRTPGSAASGTPLPRPATFSNGASLRMTYASNDTSMVELNAPVPVVENPFFVGWDRRDLATPGNPQVSNAVTIHHPAGHEKRISLDEDSLSVTTYLGNTATPTGSHYRIGNWEHGTTEGGSSGSALYTPEGHLIGTLHGGYASCSSNTQDWYGRIHQSWAGGGSNATRLSNWLDPLGSAPDIFDGYRGEPLPEADLSLMLDASPNPVDIGDSVTISAEVANAGPEDSTGVTVTFTLPGEFSYSGSAPVAWSCSDAGNTVTCALTGTLDNGTSAPTLEITADVIAVETGFVDVGAEVTGASTDLNPSNNTDSIEVEITGKPPLPDAIFCDGFEGGDGSCTPDVDPDIVFVDDVDLLFANNGTGSSINWLTSATCNCDAGAYHLNIWNRQGVMAFFFPIRIEGETGLVANAGGLVEVLQSGATIGPDSTYELGVTDTYGSMAALWRQAEGVHGYVGFRFPNPNTGAINYGYAEMTTTGTTGFPVTIHRYWYNSAGNAISIP